MRLCLLFGVCVSLLVLFANPVPANEVTQNMDQTLKRLVAEQRASAGLVGLGVMVMQNGEILGSAVDGKRKKGSKAGLTVDDRWHIGSITKSVTATMLARLVEKGELSWSTSISDVFSKVDGLDAGWKDVTLEHLLTHTSGAPANFPFLTNFKKPAEGEARMSERKSTVINLLKKKPGSSPGEAFEYSNAGYTIAGVLAEQITGKPWEALVRQEVFDPLQIQNAGFGPPQDNAGELSQPRGHSRFLGFVMAAGSKADNTPVIGPAGTIHMTLREMLVYANEHLQGDKNNGILLKADTYKRLHTPLLENYAYGWVIDTPQESDVDSVVWHNGSNTMWYALLAYVPDINAVFAVTSNDGNIMGAEQSAWKIIKELMPLLAKDA